MTTINKDFSTPSRHNISDTGSPKEDFGSAKRKAHNPLCVSSSKFLSKNLPPPTYAQDPMSTTYDSTDVTHSSVVSEPLNGPTHIPITEHLDLNSFKIKPCPLTTQHNHKHCPFYHNAKDRKRLGFFFSAEMCDYAEKENITCPNGDMCPKAHNRVEQLYRPDKYKTKFCTFYPNYLDKCEYGTFCSFSHNENDIIIELIHNYEYDDDFYMFHFKTVWCPFNLTQHDKALCVYAHNWQDYRRKPHVYVYEPTPCPNWKSTDFILNYEDGCPFKEKCTKCHGWKEHEYHPFNYKSKPCPAGKNCAKGRDCPHYHTPKERRVVSPNVVNRVFRYVPRNRIVTNTFKVRSEERGYHYAQPPQQSNNILSNQSIGSHPSLIFSSHENDSYLEQYPSSLTEQLINNPSKSNINNVVNENVPKTFDFSREREDVVEKLPRKQSYDFDSNRPRKNSGINPSSVTKLENPMYGLESSDGKLYSSKARRWSTNEEGRFTQDSDRLFREIVMSSLKKDSFKPESVASPGIFNQEDKEEGRAEIELTDNIMLDKILEN